LQIDQSVRIVLVEGNYVLLYDLPPWDQLSPIFDHKWFISCDLQQTRDRIIKRHMGTGDSVERATFRADNNDLVNGRLVDEVSRKYAERIIESIEVI